MLILEGVTYTHPDRDVLFSDLDLIIHRQDKIALIGNNGAGKSTLLNILTGALLPASGIVKTTSKPYYVPQLLGPYNDYTIGQVLQIDLKLIAIREILRGNATEENLVTLDDHWTIEEDCEVALAHWKLAVDLSQKFDTLSGGQKTKVFLAGIMIHHPEIVLLDEPSNHLDFSSRQLLYDYVKHTDHALVVVSHDRTLLNLLPTVHELTKQGVTIYGGNYDFYVGQKQLEHDARQQDLKSKEKSLRKAKDTERESLERKQKLDARGKKKQQKAGLPTILMNTLKNNAEKSTSRLKDVHAEKIETISHQINELRENEPDRDKIKMDFDNSVLHHGKVLLTARNVNTGYGDSLLWKQGLNFQITSGERTVIKGQNGSGKTTLLKMILGKFPAQSGVMTHAHIKAIYIDQDYSLIDNSLTVYEQAQQFNSGALHEHEVKIRLNRFLFPKESWDKPCHPLSGGEKMRLMLCCLQIHRQAPDMIVLDEPTNNLDIPNVEILTAAIRVYRGTLLVVSHDDYFLDQIQVQRSIFLE
jgi:ATPase subunit of ABC transporter with duplicated ATPase domains